LGQSQQLEDDEATTRYDNRWLKGEQLPCGRLQPIGVGSKAIVNPEITTIDPAQVPEPPLEIGDAQRIFGILFRESDQDTDDADTITRLGSCWQWPRRQSAGEKGQDVSTPHFITSPADEPNTRLSSPLVESRMATIAIIVRWHNLSDITTTRDMKRGFGRKQRNKWLYS
jgi:hypothetical protein